MLPAFLHIKPMHIAHSELVRELLFKMPNTFRSAMPQGDKSKYTDK